MKASPLTNFILVGKKAYQKMPPSLLALLFPLKLLYRIAYILNTLRLHIWVVTGKEKLSNEKLAICYAGTEKDKNFFVKLTLQDPYEEAYIGRVWLWQLQATIKKKGLSSSLMTIEIHNAFRRIVKKKNVFYIPCWIRGEVDISPDDFFLTRSRNTRRDIRKITENRLDFEITNDRSHFDNFYYNMYLPYISQAYDDSALIWTYENMYREFKTCDLLLVKKETEYIAGVIIKKAEKPPYVWVMGIKDANLDYVKIGARQAIYYFSISYLRENGYKRVNLGHTRAFLKDGVLHNKKKWRLELIGISQKGFLIKQLSRTPGTEAFLLNNPFIYTNKGRLNAAVFIRAAELSDKKLLKKLHKEHFFSGISKLFIYRFGDTGSTTEEIPPPVPSYGMTIRSAEDLFDF